MTPEDLYRYDVSGFTVIEDAVEPQLLRRLNACADAWGGTLDLAVAAGLTAAKLAPAVVRPANAGSPRAEASILTRTQTMFDDPVVHEAAAAELIDNPPILPWLAETIQAPRLKSSWMTFKKRGGATGGHGNHTPYSACNLYHFNGRIRQSMMVVMYALDDVRIGGGALKVIPGSHKANYAVPPRMDLRSLLVEIPLRAGSALLFTHDLWHESLNESDRERRTIILTYAPQYIANSGSHSLYDQLHAAAPEGSWRRYLTRRPFGMGLDEPPPLPAESSAMAMA
jgi:ectoine hydroxylase-related dioxygenase (phytanoyl-CoA dioxygenase family)